MFTEKRTGKHTHSVLIDGERGGEGRGRRYIFTERERHTH